MAAGAEDDMVKLLQQFVRSRFAVRIEVVWRGLGASTGKLAWMQSDPIPGEARRGSICYRYQWRRGGIGLVEIEQSGPTGWLIRRLYACWCWARTRETAGRGCLG